MYKQVDLLGLFCESSVHAGSGSELGVVDLPIQREKHTNYPLIRASTLKGAIRDSFESEMAIANSLRKNIFNIYDFSGGDNLQDAINLIFGEKNPQGKQEEQFAAALSFTDARLLLFPVKSVKNTYVWITSTHALNRLKRDAQMTEIDLDFTVPEVKEDALINEGSNLDIKENQIILEEYTFKAEKDNNVQNIAECVGKNLLPESEIYNFWRNKLKQDLVILNEDDFRDFVTMSTEVIARTKIESETKVVEEHSLWYEENLPSDTLFYSLVMSTNVLNPNNSFAGIKDASQVLDFFGEGLNDRIQLGGNQTIGRGIIRTNLINGRA